MPFIQPAPVDWLDAAHELVLFANASTQGQTTDILRRFARALTECEIDGDPYDPIAFFDAIEFATGAFAS